jgi:hypothetical protein
MREWLKHVKVEEPSAGGGTDRYESIVAVEGLIVVKEGDDATAHHSSLVSNERVINAVSVPNCAIFAEEAGAGEGGVEQAA